MLLAPLIDEVSHQPIPIIKFEVSMPNKIMLLAPPADEAPNQPTSTT